MASYRDFMSNVQISKTALNYLKRIQKFEGREVAVKTYRQSIADANGEKITFIQILKSYRKIYPLDYKIESSQKTKLI